MKFGPRFSRRSVAALAGGAVIVAVGAGIAVASIPDAGGVIRACYATSQGQTRIVESAVDCTRKETAIQWNQAGPTGPQGPQGPTGPAGPEGPAGPQGPASASIMGSSGGQLSTGNNGPGCGSVIGVGSCSAAYALGAQVVSVSGTLRDLHVQLSAAPGLGVHESWTILVNGGGTDLACDIDGLATSCSNTTVGFPLGAGDTVVLEATATTLGGGAPAAVSWSARID